MHFEVLTIYDELDERIARFQGASALRCPTGCGACCLEQEIEATVLEALPLAQQILSNQQEENILGLIEEREKHEDALCVLYQPDPAIPGNGSCSCYRARPLVCRLFGYAMRRNKAGVLELSLCRVLKEKIPHAILKAEKRIHDGCDVPVYQDSFMRIASLDPDIGFRRLPVNLALKRALEKLYWKKRYGPS